MRLSVAILLPLASAFAIPASNTASIPLPSSYAWTLSQWSGDWYGIGWANFNISAPAATSSGVNIPALSLTDICHVFGSGGTTQDCNDLIAGDKTGRSIVFTLRPFDSSLQQVQLDTVYKFTDGEKTYEIKGTISRGQANTPISFSVVPETLVQVD